MPRAPAVTCLLAVAAAAVPGCVSDVFTCTTSDQCVRGGATGRCEIESACSFSDATCATGYRFATFAAGDLSGTCVPGRTGGSPDARGDVTADAASGSPDARSDVADAASGEVEVNAPVSADTTLDQANKMGNFGAAPELRVDSNAVSIIKVDLSTVGTGTVVTAELHVWTTASGGLTRGELDVFAIREAWDEGTGTGQDGAASWKERSAGTSWTDPGAGAPDSRGTEILGSALPKDDATEVVIALQPQVVSGWLAAPSSNFGLALVATTNGNRHLVLVSREGQSGRAPFLHARLRPSP